MTPVRIAAAAVQQPVTVRILSSDGTERTSFSLASANRTGGMSIAVADLGDDGTPEIILGNGLGNEPKVRVLREDGSEIGSFLAYAPNMGLGVNVAVCDLDGDGEKEIVTSPQRGGGPHIRTFDNFGALIDAGFFAYDEWMRDGVNIACGDLDGESGDEFITMPAVGGGPHVKIWKKSGATLALSQEFFAFDATDTRGLVGVVHDKMLTVATQRGSETEQKSYVIHSPAVLTSAVKILNASLGVTSAFIRDGLVTYASSQSAGIVEHAGKSMDVSTPNGSAVASAGDFDGDGEDEIVTVDAKPLFDDDGTNKKIVIDLSDQRLYAYENGLLSNSFLVSTARPPYVTPIGEHTVLAKVPLVHYAGGSGADAYDLGWIPYNLRFYPHIYIHYAPWHNNFGSVISHGCVNVNLENIKWIYEWADEGISVIVRT